MATSSSLAATAEAVLSAIAAAGLTPTPRNYEIWYAAQCGGAREVQRRLEERAQAGHPFDETFLAELHAEIAPAERQQAQTLTAVERMVRELSDVMSALRFSGDKANAYAETLQSTSSSLHDGLDVKALREVVAGLAAATVDMAEHNRKLTRKLEDSTREMDGMRTTLHKARTEALTDPLSGLANRKMLAETLHLRLKEAAAQGTPLCFLMCDIDYFKRFNDSWGHPTGDQIIRFIGSTLAKHAMSDFLCARYGGEEFSVVMPRLPLVEAHAFAEAIRAAIESKKLFRKSTNEDLGRVTVSVGLAQWKPNESVESLIERADACLYASKRGGRNRVTTDKQMSLPRSPAAA